MPAPWFLQWFFCISDWWQAPVRPASCTLSLWGIPHTVGDFSWWGVHWSLEAWNADQVLWWDNPMILSTDYYLLCWLSRKVHVFFALVVIKFLNIMSHRVLIMLIQNNGNCPCPRCLVLKSNIPMMGGKCDLKNQVTSKHLDNATHRKVIESAWTLELLSQ